MEHGFTVNDQGSHLEIVFTGLLVGDAIVAVLERIGWREVRSSRAGLLWDLRGADLSAYNLGDIARLKTYDAEAAGRAPPVPSYRVSGRKFRIAGVFGCEYDHLILRLWESVTTEDDALERRSFSDIEAARLWVGEP